MRDKMDGVENEILEHLERFGAACKLQNIGTQEEYLAAINSFLTGQEFLKLGHAVSGAQWNSAQMSVRRMREKCKVLGITCFDRWLSGIREAVQHRNREEALQIMTQMTAKRVQLRKLIAEQSAEGENLCGM